MLAGKTRKGKPVFRAWQVNGTDHELIVGRRGYTREDHNDAIELFRQLAKNELGEHGPTEFYHQYRRLQEMHLTHLAPSESPDPVPTTSSARH